MPNKIDWMIQASKVLRDKTIVKVEYMTKGEAEQNGWYKRPLCIYLHDGTWLVPMSDDEGNDGGSLATTHEDLPTIPVMWTSDET